MARLTVLLALACVVGLIVQASAEDSTLYWSLETDTESCVYTVTGDPTEWVLNLNKDRDYPVYIAPLCADKDAIRFGSLAANPGVQDVLLASDKLSQGILMGEMFATGDIDVFFGVPLNVTSLAVDHQSNNLYYTDPDVGLVVVQLGTSKPHYAILLKDLDDPRAVSVDPDSGFIFWAESTMIRRATLDAESVTPILTDVSRDSLLTVDRVSKRIFVLDQSKGTLTSLDYNGGDTKTLINDPVKYTPGMFSDMTADQGYVFAIVAEGSSVVIWDQSTGQLMAEIDAGVANAKQYSITFNHAQSAQSTSPCATNNGGCSQMCIHVAPDSRVCMCSPSYELQADGLSCKTELVSDNFVLVIDLTVDQIYQIEIATEQVHGFPVEETANQRIESVAYDSVDNTVIWIDTGNGTLRSRKLLNAATEDIIYTFEEGSVVEGIAFDRKSRTIYYTDSGKSRIGRVGLDGAHQVILTLESVEVPYQIQLDIVNGYMYWTNIGSGATIERARMFDGSNRKKIVSGITAPTGLALNCGKSMLYWADEEDKRLEEITMEGENRRMLSAVPDIHTVAVDNDYVYMALQQNVRRYSLGNDPQSSLGDNSFGFIFGIHLYESSLEMDDFVPGADGSDNKDRSGAPIIGRDLVLPLLLLCWLSLFHQVLDD